MIFYYVQIHKTLALTDVCGVLWFCLALFFTMNVCFQKESIRFGLGAT